MQGEREKESRISREKRENSPSVLVHAERTCPTRIWHDILTARREGKSDWSGRG